MKEINRRWFSMKSEGDAAEIAIFDEIGSFGVNVGDFKKELDAVKDAKSITLLINSPGGDVFAGMAIHNLLTPMREKISVRVLGLAASIASVIAMAGKSVTMAEGSYFMIHKAWTIAVGNADEMRKTAGLLDSIDGQITNVYVKRLGEDKRAAVMAQMAEETWFTAEEAQAAGFADSVEEAEQVAALADLSRFNYAHVPEAIRARATKQANPPATARDLERFLRDAGYSSGVAKAIIADGWQAAKKTALAEGPSAISAGTAGEEGSGMEPAEDATPASVSKFTPEQQSAMNEDYNFLTA